MTRAIVGVWGKSLGVRLPAEVARTAGLVAGRTVDIVTRDGEVVLKPIAEMLTFRDLLQGKSADEWRELYRDAYDWGPDAGREIIED